MKILVNNQLIEYTDEGSGKVLLFLHGWGANLNTFDNLAKHFSKNFRVIRFDFPGFGGSPKPSDNWHVDDYAKLTRDLLLKLNINKVEAIISHSFGGRVTIKGIANKYFSPNKVILMGAAGIKPRKTFKMKIYKLIAKSGKIITSLPLINMLQPKLRKRLYGSIGNLDYLQSQQMKQIFLNTINEDLSTEISLITAPTLLIWGDNDNETPISDGRLMNSLIKNSKLIIAPGVGHFVYVDAAEMVIKNLDKFVS